MSVKVMSWVWEQDLPTTKKMLLLAIADHADDEGNNAWPSKARLAKKVGVETNRIRTLLRELEIDGWLKTHKQRGGTLNTPTDRRPNLYSIIMERGLPHDAPLATTSERGLPHDAPRGLPHDAPRGLPHEPLTISNTSNTSFGSQKRTRKPDTIFDAVVSVCGLDPTVMTSSARGAVNKAVKELRDVEATAETIVQVADAYRKKWPELSISPSAIAKHYPSLFINGTVRQQMKGPTHKTCTDCGGTGWQEVEDHEVVGQGTVARCARCGGLGYASDDSNG